MTAIHPPEFEVLAHLGGRARLILSVGLPRLATRADEVAAAIASFDPARAVEFSRRAAAIPGAEALSVVARLAEPQREQVLASLDVREEQRSRLAEALHKMGDPEDRNSAAAALQRLAPEVDLTGETPADRPEEPEPYSEAWKALEGRFEIARESGDLNAAALIVMELGGLAAKEDRRGAFDKWFRKEMDSLNGTDEQKIYAMLRRNLAIVLQNRPGRLDEARYLAEDALAIHQTLEPDAGEIWKTYNLLGDISKKEAQAMVDDRDKERLLTRSRQYFRLAREARRNFPGTQDVLRNLAPLIIGTVLATRYEIISEKLEASLGAREPLRGTELEAAIRRILEGERNPEVLCEDLDPKSSMIVETILRGIADPSTLKALIPELKEEQTQAPDE